VFAVEHPDVRRLAEVGGTWAEVEPLVRKAQQTSLVDREAADTKEGVFLGVHAVNPVNGERIPCFAAPYVLMGTARARSWRCPRTTSATSRSRARTTCRSGRDPAGRAPAVDGDTMTEAMPHEGVMVNSAVRRRASSRRRSARSSSGCEAEGRGAPRSTSGCATG
jgi:leucyl-tRNA synthetase